MPDTFQSDEYLPFGYLPLFYFQYRRGTYYRDWYNKEIERQSMSASWFVTAPFTIPTTPGVSVHVYTITPGVAQLWLNYNTHNRKTRQSLINSLTDDIKAGSWILDGNPIRFGLRNGSVFLVDGQHRLRAIVAANISVPSIVVSGLSVAAQDVADTGARRSFSDRLMLNGITNARHTASLVRKVWQFQNGSLRTGYTQPTHTQLWKLLGTMPDVQVDVRRGMAVNSALRGPIGVYGMSSYLFRRINEEDAKDFFEKLTTGSMLSEGDPILLLRNKLAQNAVAKAKINEVEIAALMIKSWNAYRKGENRVNLRWITGGAHPEDFPEPQ